MAELALAEPSEERLEATLDAERNVVGAAFLGDDPARLMCQLIPAEAWYSPAHATIAEHIGRVLDAGFPVEFVTVRNSLATFGDLDKCGGVDYLIQCAEAVPSASSARAYCRHVLGFFQRRTAREKSREISAQVWKAKDPTELAGMFFDAGRRILESEPTNGVRLGQPAERKKLAAVGIPTGFKQVDSSIRFGGLGRGQLHLVMADSNAGKTSVMVQMMLAACYGDEFMRGAVVSSEMLQSEIRDKAMLQLTGWYERPTKSLPLGADYDESDKVLQSMNVEFIGRDALVNHEVSIEHIAAWLESEHRKNPLDVVYLDMFQLINTKRRDLRNEVAEREYISGEILQLALRLNCAVILTSQVTESERSRDPKGARRPFEDASTVLDVKLDRKTGERTMRVAKNRFGPAPFAVSVTWDDSRARFKEEL